MTESPNNSLSEGGLATGGVHLWFIAMTGRPSSVKPFFHIFSAEERSRFDTLPSDHGHIFLHTRGTLRLLLARYLGRPPEEMVITTGHHGKPLLASPEDSPLRFNLSHTGDAMILGFSRAGDIGVDIERRDRKTDSLLIARRTFTRDEYAHLMALPETDRQAFFLTLWTRKEALLKGIGRGLAIPMNTLEVLGSSPIRARFDHAVPSLPDGSDWYIYDVPTDSAYFAAYAVQSAPDTFAFFQCRDNEIFEGLSFVRK